MKKDDILVVKVNALMRVKADELEVLHKYILKQKETGVIVLPAWVDVITAPGDVEIKSEEKEND